MDNYDLSNLPLLGQSSDSEDCAPWLSEEQNRRAIFSGLSATVSTPEQAELQQPSLTHEEQITEQKGLADFDISLSPNNLNPPIVDKSENPFAALAAYQPGTFDDNSQHPFVSELGLGLGLLEDFTAEDHKYVPAEPEGNDVLKLPEQAQGESDAQGIIIPESTTPDTVSEKCSGKRRASEPSSLIKESVDLHVHDFLRRSGELTEKRRKPDSKEIKLSLLPLGMKTRAVVQLKPTALQTNIRQSPDKSLRDHVKKETEKWIVLGDKGAQKRYKCGYRNCGSAYTTASHLKTHIFNHIHISVYKCNHPECGDNSYFRSISALRYHVYSLHKDEKPYQCILCNEDFIRPDSYKRHMFRVHGRGV